MFSSVSGICYIFSLNKYIIVLKIILFIGKNNTVSLCTVCGTQWESSHFLFRLIFFLLKYITQCLIVYGCVANGSYFSVHHKFCIFEVKYVKKEQNAFYVSLYTTLPYRYNGECKSIHKSKLNFWTIAILPSLLLSLESKNTAIKCRHPCPFKSGRYRTLSHGRLARWRKWRACDVGEAKGLENELCHRWSNRRVGEWAVTWVKRRKGWIMSCDVGEVTERLENELCSWMSLTGRLISHPFFTSWAACQVT